MSLPEHRGFLFEEAQQIAIRASEIYTTIPVPLIRRQITTDPAQGEYWGWYTLYGAPFAFRAFQSDMWQETVHKDVLRAYGVTKSYRSHRPIFPLDMAALRLSRPMEPSDYEYLVKACGASREELDHYQAQGTLEQIANRYLEERREEYIHIWQELTQDKVTTIAANVALSLSIRAYLESNR